MQEKQILLDYLSQNGFSNESATLYVNSLLKNPEEPTGLKISAILNSVKFTLKLNTPELKTLELTEPVKIHRINPLSNILDDFIDGKLNEDEVNQLITQFDNIKKQYNTK
ncbi:hypothetical protein [Chryseobacterium timonianum]|uniref:hypothetical protein n=1 Tax=Chryseobacterium timonianum TaxID=1805473 RepID=UPI001F4B3070|nr:hypothetical protein [Chryseobacterium timonianum]